MRYLFSLLFVFTLKVVSGQTSSLLWEISGKGLKKPSYLYGTMHMRDERVFRFGDSVLVKFDRCEVFVGELDLSKDLGSVMKLAMMPGDTTLDMLLSPEDYDFVKRQGRKILGSRAILLDRMKPIFTSALVTEESSRKDSTEPLDLYFQNRARARGMKIAGLETGTEQMEALDNITLKEQAEMLLTSLKDPKKADKSMNELLTQYMNQDLDGIYRSMREYETPEAFNHALIHKRNKVMVQRIPKLIKKQSAFIAIGAAHLPGEAGVIQLLSDQGYKVRPVISGYTPSLRRTDLSGNKDTVPSGWFQYKTIGFQVLLPAEPKINEESDQKVTTAYVLEPNTDNLFSVTFHSKIKMEQTSEEYFKEVIDGYAQSNTKITSEKMFMENGNPVLELEASEGVSTIRMKYFFLEDKVVELAVTANKEEVRSPGSEIFFNSFKVNK